MLRLLAIGLVWLGCAVAWVILGATVLARTGESSDSLRSDVHALWGPPQQQAPASASYTVRETVEERETVTREDGTPVERVKKKEIERSVPVELVSSKVAVDLALEHRQKGLMWFPTYGIAFRGDYAFRNDTEAARLITVTFPLREGSTSYDGFEVSRGGSPVPFAVEGGAAHFSETLNPGEQRAYSIAYRTRGTTSWRYELGKQGAGRIRNFELDLRTNFANIDFPAGTISPNVGERTAQGWHGTWRFASLISGAPIGIELPQRLNPGPLASKITFFAPVSLLFFFFVVAVLAAMKRKDLHPMHYFLFGCAFFAFHLLFAYLVDHLSPASSFLIASATALLLVISYARLFVGWRFALLDMGLAQFVYLVLFSYSFFWEGFTGLAITIGAVLTLLVVMQLTGRADWSELLRRRQPMAISQTQARPLA